MAGKARTFPCFYDGGEKRITIWLLGIFFVGLSALLYPAVNSYWNSKTQSKAVMNYTECWQSMDAVGTGAMFAAAEQYNRTLAALDFPLAEYTRVEGCEEAMNIEAQGIIGYLSADCLHIKLPIYHGTSESVLSVACAHLEGSGLPIGGAGAHVVLSAHRGLPSVRLFTGLDMRKADDRFRIVILDEYLPMKLISSASSCRQRPTTSRSRKMRTTAHCSPVRRMASICTACWSLSCMFA